MASSREPPADRPRLGGRVLRTGMRPQTVLFLYVRRLRRHPVQELLTGAGIAIGVALAFAVQVAGGSVGEGARNVVDGVAGQATLQISARGGPGLDPALADAARRLPAVAAAAAVLEQPATLVGPSGHARVVRLAGLDEHVRELGGPLGDLALGGNLGTIRAMFLPTAVAHRLGVDLPPFVAGPPPFPPWLRTPRWAQLPPPTRPTSATQTMVSVVLRGQSAPVLVAATLGADRIGALAEANIAGLPLGTLQELAHRPDQASRILVRARPGQEAAARTQLERLARDRADVGPIDTDARLLDQATAPTRQATTFFAAISGLVGFLLAFNAMLLTAPERRQAISDLRLLGFRRRQVATILLFQATVLGLLGSLVGLLLGGVLSREFLHETPDYLATAFPLSSQSVVTLTPVAITLAGGMIATYLAALPPLLDLRHGRALDAGKRTDLPGGIAARTSRACLLIAATLLVVSAGLLAAVPSAAFAAGLGVAAASLFVLPAVFPALVSVAHTVAARFAGLNTLTMALMGLRTTTARSLALAATGAIAVFGSVAVAGAHQDLLDGLSSEYRGYVSSADLWIAPPNDSLATTSFPAGTLVQRLRTVPGVADVRPSWGGYLDVAGRRTWLLARADGDDPLLPPGQLVRGEEREAAERLRAGGWVTVSETIAAGAGVGPSGVIRLPTPTGTVPFRVAATTTNLGWSPGAIVMGARDYRRYWGTSDPTALEVDVAPGADPAAVARDLRTALGPRSGLQVQTAAHREAEAVVLARQGLERLSQISILLLAAAALAMASAMGAAMWQRRRGLAALRLQSFRPRQLWRILLMESAVVLTAGCLTGAVFGLAGQALIDLYLRQGTGFPAPFTIGGWETAQRVLLVVAAALAVLSIPGWFASRVSARTALQE